MRSTELALDLGDVELVCTGAEIEGVFAALLAEAREFTRRLRPDERTVLRRVMAAGPAGLTVRDLFPGFTRESEGHRTLRRLRAAHLVRPAGGGHWTADTRVEVRAFGRLVWDRLGESGIFPEIPQEAEAEMPNVEEEVPLAFLTEAD